MTAPSRIEVPPCDGIALIHEQEGKMGTISGTVREQDGKVTVENCTGTCPTFPRAEFTENIHWHGSGSMDDVPDADIIQNYILKDFARAFLGIDDYRYMLPRNLHRQCHCGAMATASRGSILDDLENTDIKYTFKCKVCGAEWTITFSSTMDYHAEPPVYEHYFEDSRYPRRLP